MEDNDIEVEAKARIGDHEDICRMLESRGAVFEEKVLHRDTYYAHPSRNYVSTDEAIRVRTVIREEGVEYRMTYKGPRLDAVSKTREEVEVGVDSGEAAGKLLERLRFKPVATVTKKRLFYSLPPLKITVDDVEGLGRFVEVETTAGDNWERARDGVVAFIHSIGCGNIEKASYLELLLGLRDADADKNV